MKLHELKKIEGNLKKSKRVGRGRGSGKGEHTAGKGTKGQKARVGNSIPFGFEGGQVPLFKRMPKIRGFRNPASKNIFAVNISRLNVFADNEQVNPTKLKEKGIVRRIPSHGVKLLGMGDLTSKVKLSGFMYSQSALEKIKSAGAVLEDA